MRFLKSGSSNGVKGDYFDAVKRIWRMRVGKMEKLGDVGSVSEELLEWKDEIEAALDDSNVNRFAKYLHKLTKNTQFIVITHRRGTMAAADRLYGITMQEKGISTLVSVNLIEEDLDK